MRFTVTLPTQFEWTSQEIYEALAEGYGIACDVIEVSKPDADTLVITTDDVEILSYIVREYLENENQDEQYNKAMSIFANMVVSE